MWVREGDSVVYRVIVEDLNQDPILSVQIESGSIVDGIVNFFSS